MHRLAIQPATSFQSSSGVSSPTLHTASDISMPLHTLAEASPTNSFSTNPAMQIQLNGRVFTQDTQNNVIADVIRAFLAWDHSKSIHLQRHSIDLHFPEHAVMALFLDAVFKHHCGGKYSAKKIPSDQAMKALFAETLKELLTKEMPQETANILKKMQQWDFEPHLEETLVSQLDKKFSQTPQLRDIAKEHRWRFLVDRSKLEILERHGIAANNPFLAILFNLEERPARGYARNTANGWIDAMAEVDQPFTLEKANALHAKATRDTRYFRKMRFGAFASNEGLSELAHSMAALSTYGITSFLETGSRYMYLQTLDHAIEMERTDDTKSADIKTIDGVAYRPVKGRKAKLVKDLLDASEATPTDRPYVLFHRILEQEGVEWPERLDQAILDFMAPVNQLLDKLRQSGEMPATEPKPSEDEIFECIAEAYLRLEHLHAKGDGNYRLWGLYARNIWLILAGRGLSLVRDPNEGDAHSRREVADMLKEGEEFCHFLRTDFQNYLDENAAAYFELLGKHVTDGDLSAVMRMQKVARLYPHLAPRADHIHELLLKAISRGSSLPILTALTDFPNFNPNFTAKNGDTWLSLAARAKNQAFCSRLFCMGADPDSIETNEHLDETIVDLFNLARLMRRCDPRLEAYEAVAFSPLFRAFKSYDISKMRSMVESSLSETPPLDFIAHSLATGSLLMAFSTVVIARGKINEQLRTMSPPDIVAQLQRISDSGSPLLSDFIFHDRDVGVFSYLACLSELPIGDKVKLDVLTTADHQGYCPLVHATNNDKTNVVHAILDMIDQLHVSEEDKLDAILATNVDKLLALYPDGEKRDEIMEMNTSKLSVLDLTSDPATGNRILSSIMNLEVPDRVKFDKLTAIDEQNSSCLLRCIESGNTGMFEQLSSAILNLQTIPEKERANLVYEDGDSILPEMEEDMGEAVSKFLEKLGIAETPSQGDMPVTAGKVLGASTGQLKRARHQGDESDSSSDDKEHIKKARY